MPHIAHGKEYDSINRCRRHSKTNIKETGTLFQTEQVGQRHPDKEGSSDALEHYGQRHAMAAVRELGLETGKEAVAVIKATSVMFGVE
ncbi:hypothetical protein [Clostridium sp. 1001283B150225_161107_B6]|uniref:hypothetical protein n=1 Tax=Clostridium sp. 1001283B150225_161107_B6 TaxID=2787141 RepID=UPI001A9AD5FB|nr:hypothetical protein [Clostridium sp. 1001283B150225_161107_B6]